MRTALLSLAAATLLLVACIAREQTESRATLVANVLLVVKTADNPFFQEMERGTRKAVEASGQKVNLQVRSGESESDVTGQRKALEWFYNEFGRQPNAGATAAVLITPAASHQELTDKLLAFRQKGIPVVILDTRIDKDALKAAGLSYTAYFGSNNKEGGKMAARELLRAAPTAHRVLLLGGVEGQETAVARREGFKAEITANVPTIQVVERTCNWRRTEARKTVEALLAAASKFDAVFAANDEMALGAIEAIEASSSINKPKVVIGFDAIPEAKEAVKSGKLTATIAQSPADMGRMAVEFILNPSQRGSSMIDKDVPLQVVRH